MIAKIFIILGVLAAAMIVCLQLAGIINGDIASDVLGRTLGIIAVLGLALGLISLVVGGKRKSAETNNPPNSGPKF